MARSTYIYIAHNHCGELLGAWTVKRELIQYAKDALNCHKDYRVAQVTRVPDGLGAGCKTYKADDISNDFKHG